MVEESSIDQRRREIGGGLPLHDHATLDAIIAHVESRDFDRHVAAYREGGRHLPARLLPVIDDEMYRRVVHLSRFR